MTDDDQPATTGASAGAIDLVVVAPDDEHAAAPGLPYSHAAVLSSDAELTKGVAAARGRVFVEVSATTEPGVVTAAAARARALGPQWSLTLGVRHGGRIAPAVGSELAVLENGWADHTVTFEGEWALLDLVPSEGRHGRPRPEVEGRLVGVVEALGQAAVKRSELGARLVDATKERDRALGRLRQANETVDTLEQEQRRLTAELQAAREQIDGLRREHEGLRREHERARQRIARLESTKALRVTRRYWRARTRLSARMGSLHRRLGFRNGG